SAFLKAYGLPSLSQHRSDGWAYFLHLYVQIIEDIPLLVKETLPKKPKAPAKKAAAPENVSKITVHFAPANETVKSDGWEEMPYKVTWRIFDKNGDSGAVLVIN